MNICKAVQSLQQNLESLTLQTEGVMPKDISSSGMNLNPEEEHKHSDEKDQVSGLKTKIQEKLKEQSQLEDVLKAYQNKEGDLKRQLRKLKDSQKYIASQVRSFS